MPTPDLAAVELQIVQQTNAFRREHKLGELKPNAVLRAAAEGFARYLAKTNTFSHTADGRQPAERAKTAGYSYCLVAENLALNMDSRGFSSVQLATDAVEGWKKSPGHRENLLRGPLTEIGVAIAKAPGEEKYLSVQLFGRPSSLQYQFKITNRSDASVTYKLDGAGQSIQPREIVTHTECNASKLSFESASRGLFSSKQPIGGRFEPKAGASYVIEASGTNIVVGEPK